jgi:hypothetical protein
VAFKIIERLTLKVAALNSLLPASSFPELILFTALMAFGEESLWPASGLMSQSKGPFAGFVLPTYCESKAEAEPKRNILCVPQNDFSSKFLQVGFTNPPADCIAT